MTISGHGIAFFDNHLRCALGRCLENDSNRPPGVRPSGKLGDPGQLTRCLLDLLLSRMLLAAAPEPPGKPAVIRVYALDGGAAVLETEMLLSA